MSAGAAVACVGGGHGLAATLRSVVGWAGSVTAVVSAADDGGSSGRLRDELGILPPGDLRRCLSALADPASVLGGALEHRFQGGALDDHALGNLLIAGLMGYGLDVEAALAEVGRLVGASGRVLPTATVPVTLTGEGGGQGPVEGQALVQDALGLRRLAIAPADPPTPSGVSAAIEGADLVVLGPGSLFTSVLAAAVVPGVARALAATRARRVLVLNLGVQGRETEGLSPDDHVQLAVDHGVAIDVVLADPRFAPERSPVPVVVKEVGADGDAVHEPSRLGPALAELVARAEGSGEARRGGEAV